MIDNKKMNATHATHGGRRAGAGRKAGESRVFCGFRITPEQRTYVAQRGGSAYVRALIAADMAMKK